MTRAEGTTSGRGGWSTASRSCPGWAGQARPGDLSSSSASRQGETGQVVEFGLGDPGVLADAQHLGGDLVPCHLQGQAERKLAVNVALAAGCGLALRHRIRVRWA